MGIVQLSQAATDLDYEYMLAAQRDRKHYGDDPVGFITERLGEYLWSKQAEIARAVQEHRRVAVHSAHDVGKALALTTPIPTPSGWVCMGDLVAGDTVFDEAGQPAIVVAVSPTYHDRRCYRLVFDDRSSLVASDEHLWSVTDFRQRGRHRRDEGGICDWRDHYAELGEARTTEQLAANLRTASGQRRWSIPNARPLLGVEAKYPIGPYTLGVWLGDGTATRYEATLNAPDADEIIAHMEGEGTPIRFRRPHKDGRLSELVGLGRDAVSTLRSLGLYGHKRVPPPLMRGTRDERLAVLAGLIDTDGWARSDNGLQLDLCNERLANDAAELVSSLGWKAYRSYKEVVVESGRTVPVYRLMFTPTEPVARLKRKNRFEWEQPQRSRHTHRTIARIEDVATVPVRCITVDSPSHLFLAGESMIPTHNSFLAARIVAWWLEEHEDPFAVTTAPTGRQVRAILWREIGRAHAKGGLRGRLNQTEWWLDVGGTDGAASREEMIAFGQKPSDYDPAAFQGIHALAVLVVLDEAAGVPETIFTAADTLTSGGDSRILAIGNPDDPSSHFAKICRPGSGWYVIHIDGLESPNFTDEPVPDLIRNLLLSRAWVEEKQAEWGEGSPLYVAKVRGLFPEDAADGVVPLSWVRRCQAERDYEEGDLEPVELGVDVGAGGDFTVVRERRGMKAGRTWRKRTPDPAEASGLVVQAIAETGAARVKVDVIGVGWGIAGRLRELGEEGVHGAEVVGVNVATASSDPKRFPNLRSQMWWEIGRELSRTGAWDLSDVDDDAVAQLIEPKYALDSAGRVKVEPKDETIKRLGHSPDDADALLLAFFAGGKRNLVAY